MAMYNPRAEDQSIQTDLTAVETTVGTVDISALEDYAANSQEFITLDQVSAITIPASDVSMVLAVDEESTVNNSFSLDGGGIEVNCLFDGAVQVSYSVDYIIANTSGGTRGTVQAIVERATAAGTFAFVPASLTYSYHRETTTGNSNTKTFLLNVSNGDRIRIRYRRLTGSTNVQTAPTFSGLRLRRIV